MRVIKITLISILVLQLILSKNLLRQGNVCNDPGVCSIQDVTFLIGNTFTPSLECSGPQGGNDSTGGGQPLLDQLNGVSGSSLFSQAPSGWVFGNKCDFNEGNYSCERQFPADPYGFYWMKENDGCGKFYFTIPVVNKQIVISLKASTCYTAYLSECIASPGVTQGTFSTIGVSVSAGASCGGKDLSHMSYYIRDCTPTPPTECVRPPVVETIPPAIPNRSCSLGFVTYLGQPTSCIGAYEGNGDTVKQTGRVYLGDVLQVDGEPLFCEDCWEQLFKFDLSVLPSGDTSGPLTITLDPNFPGTRGTWTLNFSTSSPLIITLKAGNFWAAYFIPGGFKPAGTSGEWYTGFAFNINNPTSINALSHSTIWVPCESEEPTPGIAPSAANGARGTRSFNNLRVRPFTLCNRTAPVTSPSTLSINPLIRVN